MTLRVALDLDGSLESLGDSMRDLADALSARGVEVRRWRSRGPVGPEERAAPGRRLWGPWWRRGRGPAIDRREAVDVVHVAGLVTPPTRAALVVSVDDLRPLREESRIHQRVAALERVLARGATLVASSRAASLEVLEVLGAPRSQVRVLPPAVPVLERTVDGSDLVVNVTGVVERAIELARPLAEVAAARGSRVVMVASAQARQRLRAAGLEVEARPRERAREALGGARVVVHLSDGARFPSFAVAALSAGVPTVARSTAATRELLEGAASLVDSDEGLVARVGELFDDEARRAVQVAAGLARAQDFSAATAAGAYEELYRGLVEGWRP